MRAPAWLHAEAQKEGECFRSLVHSSDGQSRREAAKLKPAPLEDAGTQHPWEMLARQVAASPAVPPCSPHLRLSPGWSHVSGPMRPRPSESPQPKETCRSRALQEDPLDAQRDEEAPRGLDL